MPDRPITFLPMTIDQTSILPGNSLPGPDQPERPCPVCRTPNRLGARFCNMCGAALAEPEPQQDASFVQLRPGMTLEDRYTVQQKIGEGGLGRVYLGVDRAGRKYVLKQIREQHPGEDPIAHEMYIRSFQRQADILSSLPHPYLPIARDFIASPENLVIVMDYVEGRTLSEIMAEASGPLPEKRVLPWAVQVCEALAYLHSKQPPIIHRNIKPKNIILEAGESEHVRLIGFGLARYYIAGLEHDEDNLGTAGFSPPEQYGGAQTDPRSDIFGLGATLFTLLTQHNPADFVRVDEHGQVELHFPPPHELNPRLSQPASQIVAKALQADPALRFQSGAEMKAALEEILYQKPVEIPVQRYLLGQPVPQEETRFCEFKEIKAADPVRAIGRLVEQYVVAFLNSEGGRILWGIRDEDRVVSGVPLDYRQRDEIRRTVIDKILHIQPAIAPSVFRINFHEVYDGDQPMQDVYIVEIYVPRPQTKLLYFTSDEEVYVKTEAGKKKLSGTEIQAEIIRRLQKSP
ncbi:MAG: protein kinase [Chloroflexota bacterium]